MKFQLGRRQAYGFSGGLREHWNTCERPARSVCVHRAEHESSGSNAPSHMTDKFHDQFTRHLLWRQHRKREREREREEVGVFVCLVAKKRIERTRQWWWSWWELPFWIRILVTEMDGGVITYFNRRRCALSRRFHFRSTSTSPSLPPYWRRLQRPWSTILNPLSDLWRRSVTATTATASISFPLHMDSAASRPAVVIDNGTG